VPEINSSNNLSVSWKWVAGILSFIIIGLMGGWAGAIHLRTTALEGAVATRGERIALVEGRASVLETQYKEIREALRDLAQGQESLRKELFTRNKGS